MSLSKQLCLRNDSLNLQSFSERVCDDLCEVILQFLPLKDKLRLENVSQQFQRTVFQKQYELDINSYNPSNNNWLKGLIKRNGTIRNGYNMTAIESLLKKCPNIKSISLQTTETIDDFNRVIRLITIYCDHLIEFRGDLCFTNKEVFNGFQEKFGTKIRHWYTFEDINRLNRFPNLETIRLCPRYASDFLTEPKLKLNRVKILDFVFPNNIEPVFKKAMDNFGGVSDLTVYFNSQGPDIILNTLKLIQTLKDLTHLNIITTISMKSKLFSNSLKEVSNKCRKLKSIECKFDFYSVEEFTQLRQLLSPFKTFKRLGLRINLEDNNSKDTQINTMFSFEVFKEFSNLTHLSLEFINFGNNSLNDSILNNIYIHSPKLQYLSLWNQFLTESEGMPQYIDILSRLSRLQTIKLYFSNKVVSQLIGEQIAQKCRKIKNVFIND